MMKVNFLTILAVIFVMILTTALIRAIGEYSTALPDETMYACTTDSQCVAVPADGCGCTTGGQDTAINRKFADEWQRKQPPKMCTMMYVECNERPECVEGTCRLVPTK